MPIPEKWRPGERKSGVPTGTWNAFSDHLAADRVTQTQEADRTPFVPFKVKALVDTPRLGVVGLERPVPNPLGGYVTAIAKSVSGASGGTVSVTDVELVNNNLDPAPTLPTGVPHPGGGVVFVAGETVALHYDADSETWSFITSGQRGGHLKPPMMLGVPCQAKHATAFAILQDPARAGTIVNAIAAGVTWAKINVTNESHTHAKPPANAVDADPPVVILQSGASGARILWVEPGIGERWGLVLLGGVGGGGGSLSRVMVYSDLKGGVADTDGKISLGDDVLCLPVVLDGSQWKADLDAEFITAKVWSLGSLAIDATGCGCDEATTVPTGVRLTPGMGADGNDRVYDGDADGGLVAPSGSGVAPAASVTVSFTDGTTTIGPVACTNNGDGTFDCPSTDIGTLDKGPVAVSATDGATTDTLMIVYSADDTPTEIGHFTGRPPTPDMTAATDLGASDSDNVTSDTTPDFACAHGGVSPIDLGGPTPRFYTKGVNVASGTASSYTTTPPVVSSVILTPASPLDAGPQRGQLILHWTDSAEDYWSPPSLPLDFDIDSGATEESEPAKKYARLGWLTYDAEADLYFVTVDKCRYERSDGENTKLEA